MKILAIDQATKTGWACSNGESGVADFKLLKGDMPYMRFIYFVKWLDRALTVHKPDLIVYEQTHSRGPYATAVCVGLVSNLKAIAKEFKIPVKEVHSGTLKKHATGHGKASKQYMMDAATDRGWTFADDNEADALWLLDYAIKEWGSG